MSIEGDPRERLRRERLTEMALIAIHLRISPAEYWALTSEERDALVTQFNRLHQR